MKKNNRQDKEYNIEKQREQQTKRWFKRKIQNTFQGAGFIYVPTHDKELFIGHRTIEIDAMYIYENFKSVRE